MENASKALIIAGAILLAIVIISLGLIVVNNVRNVTDNTNLSEQEIQSFNAKFTSYEGTSVAGSRVNSLIQQVIATNQATKDAGNNNYICIGFPSISLEANSKPYMFICIDINGDLSAAFRSSYNNVDDLLKNGVTDLRKSFKSYAGSTTHKYSISVNTGKTYTVKLGYENGLVQDIAVMAN